MTSWPQTSGGAVGGLQDGGQHAQRGGFAGAVGAEQTVDLAGLAGEGDVIDGANLAALLVVKDLDKTTRFDHGAILSSQEQGGRQPVADGDTQVLGERYQKAKARSADRRKGLSFVAVWALFRIELISGHTKDVVALDADAMNVAWTGLRDECGRFV